MLNVSFCCDLSDRSCNAALFFVEFNFGLDWLEILDNEEYLNVMKIRERKKIKRNKNNIIMTVIQSNFGMISFLLNCLKKVQVREQSVMDLLVENSKS